METCSKCGREKTNSHSWCLRCKNADQKRRYIQKHPEYIARQTAARKLRTKENPRYDKNYQLKAKFGITIQEYDNMLRQQGGLCAICGRPETSVRSGKIKNLAVDHNHNTGEIRQLLCCKCNAGIGNFEENPELLIKAIDYIKKHNDN